MGFVDTEVTSTQLPGGDLVSAVLDRRVMALADRGGASRAIGDRWADVCAEEVQTWVGLSQPAPASGEQFTIRLVARLDSVPAVAATAARRGLQNPDLLLRGEGPSGATVQALDAKFSIETAKERQVSQEMLRGLMAISDILEPLVGPLSDDMNLIDGLFLCPDYALTHIMFGERRGIAKATVRPEQVMVLPIDSADFFGAMDPQELMAPLEELDRLPVRSEASVLVGLYYFRLSRAAAGIWADATRPLLETNGKREPDLDAVRQELADRRTGASSAWRLILDWDRDVDVIRNQRTAVAQVAGLPISGKLLRERIEAEALETGRIAPSVNKVRRRLGAWYGERLHELVGPITPPVADLGAILTEIARAASTLRGALDRETELAIVEAVAASEPIAEVEGAPR